MNNQSYAVVLVHSTSHALRAEKILREESIPCTLIPVPRHLSSDCGVCVRLDRRAVEKAQAALQGGRVAIDAIHEI